MDFFFLAPDGVHIRGTVGKLLTILDISSNSLMLTNLGTLCGPSVSDCIFSVVEFRPAQSTLVDSVQTNGPFK